MPIATICVQNMYSVLSTKIWGFARDSGVMEVYFEEAFSLKFSAPPSGEVVRRMRIRFRDARTVLTSVIIAPSFAAWDFVLRQGRKKSDVFFVSFLFVFSSRFERQSLC